MKTQFSKSTSETIRFTLPLRDLLEAFLTAQERASVEGYTLSAWSDTSPEASAEDSNASDDLIHLIFAKSRDFKRDESGALVEETPQRGGHCLTKKEAEKLFDERLAAAQTAGEFEPLRSKL